jgi:hypothetical protein
VDLNPYLGGTADQEKPEGEGVNGAETAASGGRNPQRRAPGQNSRRLAAVSESLRGLSLFFSRPVSVVGKKKTGPLRAVKQIVDLSQAVCDILDHLIRGQIILFSLLEKQQQRSSTILQRLLIQMKKVWLLQGSMKAQICRATKYHSDQDCTPE